MSLPLSPRRSPAPSLPSYYGPRSFIVPSDTEVTSTLLQHQSALSKAALSARVKRSELERIGCLGSEFKQQKTERIRKRLEKERITSVFASASSEIQKHQQKEWMNAILASQATQTQKDGDDNNAVANNPAALMNEPSYFRGDHLLRDDHDSNKEEKSSSSSNRIQQTPPLSMTSRSILDSMSPNSIHHASNPMPKWNNSLPPSRDPALLAKESMSLSSTLHVPPETPSSRHWSKRVAKLMSSQAGGGGAMDQDLEQRRKEQEFYQRTSRMGSAASYDQRSVMARPGIGTGLDHSIYEEDDFDMDPSSSSNVDTIGRRGGHRSLFGSPMTSPTPFDRHSSAAVVAGGGGVVIPSSLDSSRPPVSSSSAAAAAPLGSSRRRMFEPPSDGTLAPHFHDSLKSYTQQWWVRLHNSENRINMSPYYIGNKSVYYQTSEQRRERMLERTEEEIRQIHKWQQDVKRIKAMNAGREVRSSGSGKEEDGTSEEKTSQQSLPPVASSNGIRKLFVSSDLNGGSGGGSLTSRSHTAPPLSSSSNFISSTPRFTGTTAGGNSTHRRLGRTPSHVDSSPPSSTTTTMASTITPTSHLHHWHRRPETMILQQPLPPPPQPTTTGGRTLLERIQRKGTLLLNEDGSIMSNFIGHRKHILSAEERRTIELEEIERIRHQNARRGTKFQYDVVSELHGFLSQKNIKSLLKQTNYNRRELYVIYVRFKALCALSPTPHGIDKHTFKKGVARLAVEDDRFVNRVFSLVDDDGSGQIEWEESGHNRQHARASTSDESIVTRSWSRLL